MSELIALTQREIAMTRQIDDLERELAAERERREVTEKQLAAEQQFNEVLREDAARYRWLRMSKGNPAYCVVATEWGLGHKFGAQLDHDVDAAIAAQKKDDPA